MMHTLSMVLLALSTLHPSFCAPSAALDADTLHQNALDAQILNAEFQGISATDPCNSGQTACVQGALARCAYGSWQLQECNDSQQCFAVPSVRDKGVTLICTSESNALSLMQAAGVSDGLVAQNGTMAIPTQAISTTGVEVATVTQTVLVMVSAVTTTISPQDASSVLASLSANGFTASPGTPSTTSGLPVPTTSSSAAAASSVAPTMATTSSVATGVTATPESDCTMMSISDTASVGATETSSPNSSGYRRRSMHAWRRAHP